VFMFRNVGVLWMVISWLVFLIDVVRVLMLSGDSECRLMIFRL